jgi:alginate O-acetyltransferase complex protein AlgI
VLAGADAGARILELTGGRGADLVVDIVDIVGSDGTLALGASRRSSPPETGPFLSPRDLGPYPRWATGPTLAVVLFPTVTFAIFFAAVWPVVWATASRPRLRMAVLVGASAVFYGWWDRGSLLLLAALIVGNHGASHLIDRAPSPAVRRTVLWLGVGLHLVVLVWFKYYGFFTASLVDAFDQVGVAIHPPLVEVALPLGISFVTFQAISRLIEVYRGVTPPCSLLASAAWLAFFPTVTAGPITRASELVPQLTRPGDRSSIEVDAAVWLVLRGLAKKVVVASYLATAFGDDVFAEPGSHSSVDVLAAIYAYAAQLYADFSGYTDIAIGVALLLGFTLPPNFDAPYTARTVTEFWSRWHITLTRWFRDFVFVPLARRRRPTTAATCLTLLVVMLLSGLWHGAAWTFVAFGAVHGVALAAERWARERRRSAGLPAPARTGIRAAGRRLRTFHVVCLGWVFFRSESLADAGAVLARLVTGWGQPSTVPLLLVVTIAAVIGSQYVPADLATRARARTARLGPVPQAALAAGALTLIDVLGPAGVPPFLYFRF